MRHVASQGGQVMVGIGILAFLGLAGLSLSLYIFARAYMLPPEETAALDYVLAFHLLVMSAVYLTGAVLVATVRHYSRRLLERLPEPGADRAETAQPPSPRPVAPREPEKPRDLVTEVLTEHGLTPPPEEK